MSGRRLPPLSEAERKRFLEALAGGAPVLLAAHIAGQHEGRFHWLRRSDPDFRAAWKDA